jgi:splicing factor 1
MTEDRVKRRRGFEDQQPKRRKSRWGAENDRVNMPGLPTALPPNLSKDQLDSYVIHLRVEELGRKLRMGTYIPREKRSVSPEPVYDDYGKRTNTRDARYRDKIEDEKVALVERGLRTIPGFRPPIDYKRVVKLQEKVYLPVRDFPEINFIGLLIGPRGHTLKKMEADTGVKISIRGKGSVKEGKYLQLSYFIL